MKKIVFIVILPLLILLACSDDNNDRWISIATVDNPDNSAYFNMNLDNSRRLRVTRTNFNSYRPRTGQRVLVDYTILERNDEMFNVRLNNAFNILTKGIFFITPETQDSIGNDPIQIRDMWIGSNFLNVEFTYWGFNRRHFINLVKDNSVTHDDNNVHLEFRYNSNGDARVYRFRGIVSFNLEALHDQEMPINLAVHARGQGGRQLIYRFEYNPQNINEKSIDQAAFLEYKNTDIE